ncbi:MAG TPA: alanine racemase, partial [Candidatus Limnocylindrales bacterium]|nr:alanine racemase [Candidatus Limnocylindrales bacterium]
MTAPVADLDAVPRRGRPPTRNEIHRAGRLGGADPAELAGRFGTPFYAYDLDVVDRQVAALRAALPEMFDIAYAVKANPSLGVVAALAGLGLGADVASGGELETAVRAGVAPSSIVVTGPGKTDAELSRAVRLGIRAVTVESPGELRRLEAIAAGERRRTPVLLRAAVGREARLERVRLVGDDGAGKFGMDREDLVASARYASASPWLEPLGLHAFGASNVLDVEQLAGHIERTVAAARDLAAAIGFELRLVDVGGGLGISYESHEESLDLVRLRRRLVRLAAAWTADPRTRSARIL